MSGASPAGLHVRGVTHAFGTNTVLQDVGFHVAPGEIVALLGENGAGKTTLLRIVSGFLRPTAGEVRFDGVPVRLRGPRDSAARGVGMVHQHFLLIPELTVAENVVLGREPGVGPLFDRRAAEAEVRACAERFALDVDPHARVRDLGAAARQRVELLKVLVRGARFLLLDEPTGLLPPLAIDDLFALVRRLAAEGCGVVLVTHRLREVFAVCSRATVLRRGAVAGEREVATTDEAQLARLMVGDEVAGGALSAARPRPVVVGAPLLEVGRVCVAGPGGRRDVDDVSFTLFAGEVVGLAGVAGSGQKELLEALAGVRPSTGEVRLLGDDAARRDISNADVAARRVAGLAFVPEDRDTDGLIGALTVSENLVLGATGEAGFARRGVLLGERVRSVGAGVVRDFDVRPPDPQISAGALSGGNQQKVLLARELRRAPRVVLAAEPARGLDFRATSAVHARLRDVARGGGAVLFAGTDVHELLEVCDRVLVMFAGRLVGEVRPGAEAVATIGLLMAGGGAS